MENINNVVEENMVDVLTNVSEVHPCDEVIADILVEKKSFDVLKYSMVAGVIGIGGYLIYEKALKPVIQKIINKRKNYKLNETIEKIEDDVTEVSYETVEKTDNIM